MNRQETYVSVVEPISPAIEHVKMVLFRPFDLGRWFIIGFCAWLANPFRGNGGGGNGRSGIRVQGAPGSFDDIRHEFDHGREFVANNPWVVPAGISVFVLMIAFWLLMTWLTSRGRFMFLDCVVQNKAEVKNPWHRFRTSANSLFAFRIVLGILWGLAALAFIAPVIITAFVLKGTFHSTALTILAIAAYALSFIAVMTVFGIVTAFTGDFVVPIMYQRALTCRQAWAVLLDVLAFNKLRFVLYLLFQIIIGVAIFVIVIALSCATCCVAGCIFVIPYIGTVALLPIIMFKRSYSLYYLAQYGPDLNVFLPRPGTAPAAQGTDV